MNSPSRAAKRVLLIAIVVVNTCCLNGQADETPVPQFLTGSNVDISEVNRAELIDIYLGRKRFWPNNKRITLIVYNSESPESKFIEPIINRSSKHLTRHWRRLAFTGQGIMPITVGSEEEMIDMLNTIPNSIGYAISVPELIDISPLKIVDPTKAATPEDSLKLFPNRVEEFIVLNGLGHESSDSRL